MTIHIVVVEIERTARMTRMPIQFLVGIERSAGHEKIPGTFFV